MEIIIATVMFLLSGGMLSGSVIVYRKRAKTLVTKNTPEVTGPKKLVKDHIKLAPGFEIAVMPSTTNAYSEYSGALQYIQIIETDTGNSVSERMSSWENDRDNDIKVLMGESRYQKTVLAAAKKKARRVPTQKLELAVDGSEIDRMKVDDDGNLVIPPARTFELLTLPPLLRWSIRGERGGSYLSLVYTGIPSSPQTLGEKGLPETGNPKKNILDAAIDLLAKADVEYGESLDVYVSKSNSLYSDYEGEW